VICAVCRREARGFGFSPSLIRVKAPTVLLCSRQCQDIVARLKGMIDASEHERAALTAAGISGGEYVERTGRTDLTLWTAEEWSVLIDVIVTAYQDHLRAAHADDVLR
jgi:hypothetical protein